MGSGGSSSEQSQQSSAPGTLSPVTATLLSLFGGPATVEKGQYVPTSFGGPGAMFTPQSFSALPGLLQNQPATAVETALTGPAFQQLGLTQALASQGLLNQAGGALSTLLGGPEAQIAQARRSFSQETIPEILERTPGFSSSDLQREVTRAGVDLETQIAALREQNQAQAISMAPALAQAVGQNLFDQASQVLGFGQLGREFMREISPAGDAFRVLAAFQGLTGPSLTAYQQGASSGKSKNVGVLS